MIFVVQISIAIILTLYTANEKHIGLLSIPSKLHKLHNVLKKKKLYHKLSLEKCNTTLIKIIENFKRLNRILCVFITRIPFKTRHEIKFKINEPSSSKYEFVLTSIDYKYTN